MPYTIIRCRRKGYFSFLVFALLLLIVPSVIPAHAAPIEVYGGGGGGGGGSGADMFAFPGNGGGGGSGGTAGLSGFSGGFGNNDAIDNSSPGGAGGGGSGGGVVGGAVGGNGSQGQSLAGNPGAGGNGGAGAQDGFAGSGGTGGTGGTGGAGGVGVMGNQSNGAATVDSISVIAGSGGNGGHGGLFGSAAGGAGGAGGAASLTLTAPTVTSTGAVLVQSGANGLTGNGGGSANGAGGTGGAASFTANTLIAPTINLTKNNGGLTFNVTTLDVSGTIPGSATTLTLTGTAASDVNIGTVALGGGNTFTVSGTGAGTFTNLNVTGTGGTLAGSYAPSFTNVSLAGGSSLTSTANPLNFASMRVLGQSAGYTGTLNAVGKTLTFDLPASLTPGQTMLNVAGNADLTGTNIGLTSQAVRPSIALGQSLTLLSATSLTANQTGLTVQTASGDIYTLLVSNNQLLAVLQQISPTSPVFERLKAYAEGRTATLSFVNQGQDLILNQGFGSALAATAGSGYQLAGFGGVSGGRQRYNTGSHVDVNGASLLAGLAVGNNLGVGRLTTGLFFEGGWGNYNSHNSFSNFASVKGDGDTSYLGGGLLGRYDVTTGALSGLYFDASARMGRAKMDFNTDDIKYNGSDADFDSSSWYYGAHAGLGYQWSFSEKAMLDLSGKFLWTRQEGDNVNVDSDRMRFKDADSLRTRLGGRFNYAVTEKFIPYAGAYWEHEFDGKARSSVNGVGIDAPTLKGDTGMGELGLTVKPVADSGFSFDLGVQGYTGVREGVTGSLQLKFEF